MVASQACQDTLTAVLVTLQFECLAQEEIPCYLGFGLGNPDGCLYLRFSVGLLIGGCVISCISHDMVTSHAVQFHCGKARLSVNLAACGVVVRELEESKCNLIALVTNDQTLAACQ